MLKSIQRFYSRYIGVETEGITSREATADNLRLAAAALLVEVTRADRQIKAEEREVMLQTVQNAFNLTEDEAAQLIELAEAETDASISLFQFTHLIDKGFSLEQKIRVIEMMWQVVFADAVMEKHEEALVRKVAGLLHVPQREYIDAKLRVREGL